jgi:pyruvate kinase
MPNTKIVATLGPASGQPETIERLIEAGAAVFRLNASHSTHEQHAERIRAVRCAAAKAGRHIGILLDLQGPKIRLGQFENGGCLLATGSRFTITTETVLGNCERASTNYANFVQDVKLGSRILLADGTIMLRAIESKGSEVLTEVVDGGPISDRKGINLPGVHVSAPSLTEKDLADLEFGLAQGVDLIALSFVRTVEDIRQLRHRLGESGIPVVAKIEKPQAWVNIDSILDETDGVMVARGDLGVEMALEKVPRIQKSIIQRARYRGKFVITATQMLESMIENPTPTRAEVSDVANAIYDGSDAVMLSAETSTGKHPVEAVRFMERIAVDTESAMRARGFQEPERKSGPTNAEIVADAAYHAARDAKATAIVVFTTSGSSARLVSRYRPPVPVFAITPSETVARQLTINFGVTPVFFPEVSSTDEMLSAMDRLLVTSGLLRSGDLVVLVAGKPSPEPGTTNMMKLHQVGSG